MTLRARLVWILPFLNALAVGAVLVTMAATLVDQSVQRQETAAARARLLAIGEQLKECQVGSPKPQPPPGVIDTRDPEDIHECIETTMARTGAAVTAVQCTAIVLAQPRPPRVPEKCQPTLEYLLAEGVLTP